MEIASEMNLSGWRTHFGEFSSILPFVFRSHPITKCTPCVVIHWHRGTGQPRFCEPHSLCQNRLVGCYWWSTYVYRSNDQFILSLYCPWSFTLISGDDLRFFTGNFFFPSRIFVLLQRRVRCGNDCLLLDVFCQTSYHCISISAFTNS